MRRLTRLIHSLRDCWTRVPMSSRATRNGDSGSPFLGEAITHATHTKPRPASRHLVDFNSV